MATHVAVLLTVAQAKQLAEAGKRWHAVKTMTDGPGRDMAAGRATLGGIRALEKAIEGTETDAKR